MRNTTRFNLRRYKLLTAVLYAKRMAYCGRGTILFNPMRIDHPESMGFGERVFVGEGAWLYAPDGKGVTLRVESGTSIGHFSHIVAYHDVRIGRDALIADKVFITDCTHRFSDVSLPIIEQPVDAIGSVEIGDGSWIGEGVSVIGARVGAHAVVGANSVVTRDVQDYSVVAGAPARVISHYDWSLKEWVKD